MGHENHAYEGRDLESMGAAENYHRWILSEFEPLLGTSIWEVGAGTGSFSELLLDRHPRSLTLIEPSGDMFALLSKWAASVVGSETIALHHGTLADLASAGQPFVSAPPDSIVYCNVLEHIEDDAAELRTAWRLLSPAGKLFVFVPAHMWLYGPFDRRIGHFRRYTRSGLEKLVSQAGFRVLKSRWFDFAGILPWFVRYRLLRSDSMPAGHVALFDNIAVPLLSRLERFIAPPTGKNVLLVAQKEEESQLHPDSS